MEYLKLRSHGRWIVAACVLGLGTSALTAQQASPSGASSSTTPSTTTPSTTAPSAATKPMTGVNPSKVDIFAGFSYLAPHGTINGVKYNAVNLGAIGSGAYYFSKFMGAEVSLAAHPDGNGDGFTTINGGPIVRFPLADMTPFAHFLIGTTRIGGPNFDGVYPNGNPGHFVNPYRWGTSLTVGGGLDYPLPFLGHRLGLRLFQADYQYMHASFGPAHDNIEGGRANINAAQLSTGLVYHMGSIIPPPPVAFTASASPSEVYPGEPVTVTGNAQNLNPKKTPTYNWTSTGGKISGTSSTANVDTTDLAPGTYTVTGHVTEGNKPGQSADANATFTVKQFEPPTISCTSSPATLNPGDSATIAAQGVSPQNRPLTYSYSASSGQVSGSTNSATVNTTGVAPGVITITCNVSDDKGQTASSTTSVTINAPPPPPPAPKVETLCSIDFGRDKRRPTRVDNEAKACLDDVALNLQRSADAKAVLVGNSTSTERHASKNAAERAVNTKAYLVSEKGIDPSRIDVRTGTGGTDSVQNYLVPSGANFDNDVQGTTAIDTSAVKVSRHPYGTAAKPSAHPNRRKAKKAAAPAPSNQ